MLWVVQIWRRRGAGRGLKGGWKITVEIQRRLCKKGIRRPMSTANEAAELEIGRESRESNMLCSKENNGTGFR